LILIRPRTFRKIRLASTRAAARTGFGLAVLGFGLALFGFGLGFALFGFACFGADFGLIGFRALLAKSVYFVPPMFMVLTFDGNALTYVSPRGEWTKSHSGGLRFPVGLFLTFASWLPGIDTFCLHFFWPSPAVFRATCFPAMEEPLACGKALQDKMYVRVLKHVSRDDHKQWSQHSIRFTVDDLSFKAPVRIAPNHVTTFSEVKKDHHYPMESEPFKTFKVTSLQADRAQVEIVHDGTARTKGVLKEVAVQDLLPLCKYAVPTTEIVKGGGAPGLRKEFRDLKDLAKGLPAKRICTRPASKPPGITVNNLDMTIEALKRLSPGAQPITLVITHEEDSLPLRQFTPESLKSSFHAQGSLATPGSSGGSCGKEAAANLGIMITDDDLNQNRHNLGVGSDAESFCRFVNKVAGCQDTYSCDRNGSDIPPQQLLLTLRSVCARELIATVSAEQSMHHNINRVQDPGFWCHHRWAMIFIPVCGGHWVSIERILYTAPLGEEVEKWCLREGRGYV